MYIYIYHQWWVILCDRLDPMEVSGENNCDSFIAGVDRAGVPQDIHYPTGHFSWETNVEMG